MIDDVQFEDAGMYQCGGINTETTSAVRRSFNVEVQCKYCVFFPTFLRENPTFSALFRKNYYNFPRHEEILCTEAVRKRTWGAPTMEGILSDK